MSDCPALTHSHKRRKHLPMTFMFERTDFAEFHQPLKFKIFALKSYKLFWNNSDGDGRLAAESLLPLEYENNVKIEIV